MNSFGCTNIPQEILDKQAPPNVEARKAWARCYANMLSAGVPAAKGASILKGLTKAGGAASLAAFAGCDFDKIRECLMVCVWEPNPHKEMNQNDYYGETRSG